VGQALNATVSGLSSNTRYVFRLAVINEAGSVIGPWTSTRTLSGLPLPVAAPELEVASATRIFVAWSRPANTDGVTLAFEVFQNGVSVFETGTTLYSADGLSPYTLYTFSVTVCSDSGCVEGETATARTEEALPQGLAAPESTAVTGTSVALSWEPPALANGLLEQYSVFVRPCPAVGGCAAAQETGVEDQVVGAQVTAAVVSDLTPFMAYQFRIVVRNAAGEAASAWTEVQTPAIAPALGSGAACQLFNDTAVLCQWSATEAFVANGPVSEVSWAVRDDDRNGQLRAERSVGLADGSTLFTELTPGNLTFTLSLITSEGDVSASSQVEVPRPLASVTNPPIAAGNGDSSLAAGGVAGVVIAVLVLVMLILVLLVYRKRRSKVTTLLPEVDSPIPRDARLDFWEKEERLVELRPYSKLQRPKARAWDAVPRTGATTTEGSVNSYNLLDDAATLGHRLRLPTTSSGHRPVDEWAGGAGLTTSIHGLVPGTDDVQLLMKRNSQMADERKLYGVQETAFVGNPAYSAYAASVVSPSVASDAHSHFVRRRSDGAPGMSPEQMHEYATQAMLRALSSLSPAAAAELIDNARASEPGANGGAWTSGAPRISVASAGTTEGGEASFLRTHAAAPEATQQYQPYEEDTWL
jgi:hypothetical protein